MRAVRSGRSCSESVDEAQRPHTLGDLRPGSHHGLSVNSRGFGGLSSSPEVSPLGRPVALSLQESPYHCVGDTSPTLCHLNFILIPKGSLRNAVYWAEEESEAQRG